MLASIATEILTAETVLPFDILPLEKSVLLSTLPRSGSHLFQQEQGGGDTTTTGSNEQLRRDWTCASVFYLLTSFLIPQTLRLMLLMVFASSVTVGKIRKDWILQASPGHR